MMTTTDPMSWAFDMGTKTPGISTGCSAAVTLTPPGNPGENGALHPDRTMGRTKAASASRGTARKRDLCVEFGPSEPPDGANKDVLRDAGRAIPAAQNPIRVNHWCPDAFGI